MSYKNFRNDKCMEFKSDLAKKQYKAKNIDINGLKSITQLKKIHKEIKTLYDDIKLFKCRGHMYLYMPIKN